MDGRPRVIDHLDLGSVGWWGEWHMSGTKGAKLPTLETRMRIVKAYFAAFEKTQLVMLIGGGKCLTCAAQHGAARLDIRFGGPGCYRLSGKRFQHTLAN